jgi:hypothetical protein
MKWSIETRSLPTLTRSYPRRFTFYVADPISSIRAVTTGSGTEPSSNTGYRRRETRIPEQMIAKFMHHKRLTMRE